MRSTPPSDRIDPGLLDDPSRCPSCGLLLPVSAPAGRCPACATTLTGPLAEQVWQLSCQAAALLRQRGALLERLRTDAPADIPPPAPVGAPGPQRRDAPPVSVRNVLLGLGVLLVLVAAAIFLVVTWGRIGLGGRALVLAGITGTAGGAVVLAQRRGLSATAESLAALTGALLLLDADAARRIGVVAVAGMTDTTYWAGVLAVLAAAAGAVARRRSLRVPALAAAVLAQLPLPLLAGQASPAVLGLALAAQALVIVLLASVLLTLRSGSIRVLLHGGAALAWLGALALGIGIALSARLEQPPGLGVLVVLAAAAAPAGLLRRSEPAGTPAAYAAVAAAAYAAVTTAVLLLAGGLALHVSRLLPGRQLLPGLALIALLGAASTLVLPHRHRIGPAVPVAATCAGVTVASAPPVLLVVAGQLGWGTRPWSLPATTPARLVLADGPLSSAPVAELLALVLLAGVVALLAIATGRRGAAALLALPLTAVAAAVVPPLLEVPHIVAVAAQLVVAGAIVTGAIVTVGGGAARRGRGSMALVAGFTAATLATLSLAWSLAAEGSTLLALPAVLGIAAGGAVTAGDRDLPFFAAAVVVALGATTGTYALSWGAGEGLAGVVVALTAAAALVLTQLRPLRPLRPTTEVAAVLSYCAGLSVAAVGGPLTLSSALTAGGVAAAGAALRPDRRRGAWISGLLLTAAGWVRLLAADVALIEAYTVPPALALLAVGLLRRRREPGTSSWPAYGPGFALGLLPSLLVALDDGVEAPLRPLLLLVAALAVTLAGAASRLQAPLALGGAVLAVDALAQLAPYAAALPRWVVLGTAGLLLLALGATYERRLQQARTLAQRLGSWA